MILRSRATKGFNESTDKVVQKLLQVNTHFQLGVVLGLRLLTDATSLWEQFALGTASLTTTVALITG